MRLSIPAVLICLAAASVNASDIRVGPVRIVLLDSGEVLRNGGGASSRSNVIYVYTTNHCFSYIFLDEDKALPDKNHPTHVLAIDGVSFGSIPDGADVRFGANRLWVDGEARVGAPIPEVLKEEMFRESAEPFNLSLMGPSQQYEILCHESAGFGRGANGGRSGVSYFDGQFVVRIENERLVVWGVDFDRVQDGDKIEVFPRKVHVNGRVRLPVPKPS